MSENILIITGEASGDARGAEMLAHLKPTLPEVSFWGFGGDRLEKEGVHLIEHIRNLSIVGVWEVLVKLPLILKQMKTLKKEIRTRKPSMAILIDYPGFNLKIARFLKKEKIPVVYYVLPQVWAWGAWRIRSIKKNVDLALCLFPFEKELFSGAGINCRFVGHPVTEKAPAISTAENTDNLLRLAILPGSRISEIRTGLPVMLKAAKLIGEKRSPVEISLAKSSNVPEEFYEKALSSAPHGKLNEFTDDTFSALAGSDLALVTSGTATLEAALSRVPMIITYHTSILTGLLFLLFSRVPNIGMVNIVAGKQIVPEILQYNATAGNIAKEALSIIEDKQRREKIIQDLDKVRTLLADKSPSKTAAQEISDFYAQTA